MSQLKLLITALPFLIICFSHLSKGNSFSHEFYIKGEIKGLDSGEIIISFKNEKQIDQIDTIHIQKSFFDYSGTIYYPTLATISYNDVSVRFYIEPKKMEFFANKNNFEKATLTGSLTNDAYFENKRTYELCLEKKQIRGRNEDPRICSFKTDSAFIVAHPNSYYSLILLNFYYSDFEYPYFQILFNNFSAELKNTDLGIELKFKLDMLKKLNIGNSIKNFNFTGYKSGTPDLDDILKAHNLVLLDFWASWCIPCRRNSSFLKDLYTKYNTSGFTILSISVDHDKKKWKSAILEDSLDQWYHRIANLKYIEHDIGIISIPTYLLINKKGIVLGRFNGRWNSTLQLEKSIENLLNRK